MQTSSKNAINGYLFTLLVATVAIPLPAMTPALLSSAVSAMNVIATSRAEPARLIPIYILPARPGRQAPEMVPDAILLGIAEPKTILNEVGTERDLAFEALNNPMTVAMLEPSTPEWRWARGRPMIGGGGIGGRPPLISGIPEPTIWVALISGFLTAGLMLRRQRPVVGRP